MSSASGTPGRTRSWRITPLDTSRHPERRNASRPPPAHDIHGKKITEFLPKGESAEFLLELMEISREIFPDHPVNRKRVEAGKAPGEPIPLGGAGGGPRVGTDQG